MMTKGYVKYRPHHFIWVNGSFCQVVIHAAKLGRRFAGKGGKLPPLKTQRQNGTEFVTGCHVVFTGQVSQDSEIVSKTPIWGALKLPLFRGIGF